MKKIAVITLNGNVNYGNRLQNYALVEYLNKLQYKGFNLWLETFPSRIKRITKMLIPSKKYSRYRCFSKFNKRIPTKYMLEKNNNDEIADKFLVGSDQVWHPSCGLTDSTLLKYINDNNKKVSFSASFGIGEIPESMKDKYASLLGKFNKISVREDAGKNIVEELTGRNDITVVIDPTMLLESSEWDKVSEKPKQIEKLCPNGEKYILNYFLGKLPTERKEEIERISKENNCKIINILDENDPFYVCCPSEFLWLEKNAFLICTDSFHSSVFAILYKRPFVVFNREDGQRGKSNMNSRLETLLLKFRLEDRYYNGKITEDLLNCDFSHVDTILEKERRKAEDFLKNALL